MLEINEGVSEEEAAENFVDNNPNLVKEWLDGVVEAAEESPENTGDLEIIDLTNKKTLVNLSFI